jgi:3-deoxy-D-manno-octulosonate 8-phosphate phosphatase (KDO 8-P phosphatase)
MNTAIKLLVMDVDGVLTDGRLTFTPEGEEIKTFHAHDGYGLKQLQQQGFQLAVITARASSALTHRLNALGIEDQFQAVKDKLAILTELCNKHHIALENVAYMGDDMPDFKAMQAVGMPIAVANARPEIKAIAKRITQTPGGQGAVREICDWLLSTKEQAA